MIQSVQPPGTSFAGLMAYLYQDEKFPELLAGNIYGDDQRELTQELRETQALNRQVEKPVFHASISAAPEDGQLDSMKWQEIAEKYVKHMGYDNAPWIAVRHLDTDHDHIHIVASRVDYNGHRVRDFQERKRGEKVLRRLEKEHGLRLVTPSELVQHSAPTRAELQQFIKTGQPSAKERIRLAIRQAAEANPTLTEFIHRLKAQDIYILPNLQSTGRVAGITYEIDDIRIKASNLGKPYTLKGLQQRLGVQYEPQRDAQAIRSAAEQAAYREDRRRRRDQAAGHRGTQQGHGENIEGDSQASRVDTALSREGRGVYAEHAPNPDTDQEPQHVEGPDHRHRDGNGHLRSSDPVDTIRSTDIHDREEPPIPERRRGLPSEVLEARGERQGTGRQDPRESRFLELAAEIERLEHQLKRGRSIEGKLKAAEMELKTIEAKIEQHQEQRPVTAKAFEYQRREIVTRRNALRVAVEPFRLLFSKQAALIREIQGIARAFPHGVPKYLLNRLSRFVIKQVVREATQVLVR